MNSKTSETNVNITKPMLKDLNADSDSESLTNMSVRSGRDSPPPSGREQRAKKRQLSVGSDRGSQKSSSPSADNSKSKLRVSAPKQAKVVCSSLEDIHDICNRLSNNKKSAIIEFVASLLQNNEQMASEIATYKENLAKQAEVNERLAKRLDALEAKGSSKPTIAQVVAKPANSAKTNKPSNVKDLAKLIPTIRAKPPSNAARIVPPDGINNPEKAILRVYNPAQYNIKVRSLRATNNNELIVRTNGPEDIKKLAQSKTLSKNGYKIVPIVPKMPKIIIFGINIKSKDELTDQIYEQNEDFAGEDPETFKSQFKPIYSWSRNNRTQNWVVEVSPQLRKAMVANGFRVYNQWQSHRVADYIDATRCFKCQKYGHVAKHCQQATEICGHCAQSGHAFKTCPNLANPPQCPACKANKLPAAHKVVDRTCPSFLKAARVQLSRTNYGD